MTEDARMNYSFTHTINSGYSDNIRDRTQRSLSLNFPGDSFRISKENFRQRSITSPVNNDDDDSGVLSISSNSSFIQQPQLLQQQTKNSCKTLKCPKCNWHYKYKETLFIHMKEKHSDGSMQCLYCLTNEMHPRLARGESHCCGYKPFRCEFCNYSTTTKGNLSIHMQSDKHFNNVKEIKSPKRDLTAFAPNTEATEMMMHRKKLRRTGDSSTTICMNAESTEAATTAAVGKSFALAPTLPVSVVSNSELFCDMESFSSTESFVAPNSDGQQSVQCNAVTKTASNERNREACKPKNVLSMERNRSSEFPALTDASKKSYAIKQEQFSPPSASSNEVSDMNGLSLVQCPLCNMENSITDLKTHLKECHKVTENGIENLIALMVKLRNDSSWLSGTTTAARPNSKTKTSFPSMETSYPVVNHSTEERVIHNKEISVESDVCSNDFADKAYRCHTCARSFLSFLELKVHINSLRHQAVVQRAPYFLCYKKGCNQYFTTNEALSIHFNEIHSKIFNEKFNTHHPVVAASQQQQQHGEMEVLSQCEKCLTVVSSNEHDECDGRCLRKISEDIGLCNVQANFDTSTTTTTTNTISKSEENNIWRCNSCDYFYANEFILKQHLENIHGLTFPSELLDSFATKIKQIFSTTLNSNTSDLSAILSADSKDTNEQLSAEQLKILESYFYTTSNFPCDEQLKILEQETSLPVKTIKNWFCKMFVTHPRFSEDSPKSSSIYVVNRDSKGNSSDSHDSIDGYGYCGKFSNETRNQNFTCNSEYLYNPSKRANRTRFTDNQIRLLQEAFERNPYPKDDELELLSLKLKLSARVVVVWFQNARQKARKSYENQVAPIPLITKYEEDKNGTYFCPTCKRRFLRYHELLKHRTYLCLDNSNVDLCVSGSSSPNRLLNYADTRTCSPHSNHSVPVDSENYSLPLVSLQTTGDINKPNVLQETKSQHNSKGIQNLLTLRTTHSMNSSLNNCIYTSDNNVEQYKRLVSSPLTLNALKVINHDVTKTISWLKDQVSKSIEEDDFGKLISVSCKERNESFSYNCENEKKKIVDAGETTLPVKCEAVENERCINAEKIIVDNSKQGSMIYDAAEVDIKLLENPSFFVESEFKRIDSSNTTTNSNLVKNLLITSNNPVVSHYNTNNDECINAILNEMVCKVCLNEKPNKVTYTRNSRAITDEHFNECEAAVRNRLNLASNMSRSHFQQHPAHLFNFPVTCQDLSRHCYLENRFINRGNAPKDAEKDPVKTFKNYAYPRGERNTPLSTSLQPRFFSLLNSPNVPPPPPAPPTSSKFVNFCNNNVEEETQCKTAAPPKRLRTTILPEQQDYLMQKFSIDSNPSRKVLEEISCEVGLKKRVVQVWFQNTRARERKSIVKTQSQHINKRCLFCGTVFKLRSALENHLCMCHHDLLIRESFDIDSFPDASESSVASFKNSLSSSNMNYPFKNALFLNKTKPVTLCAPSSSSSASSQMQNFQTQVLNRRKNEIQFFHAPFAVAAAASAAQNHESRTTTTTTQNCKEFQQSSCIKSENDKADNSIAEKQQLQQQQQQEAAAIRSSSQQANRNDTKKKLIKSEVENTTMNSFSSKRNSSTTTTSDIALLRRNAVDKDSYSGDEGDDEDSSKDFGFKSNSFVHSSSSTLLSVVKSERSSPTIGPLDLRKSPTATQQQQSSRKFNHNYLENDRRQITTCVSNNVRRFRTQMSPLQIRIMKAIFVVYKTPTMSECDQLGKHIDLQKRVVQVWFQNARAKEKKNPAHMKLELEINFPPKCSSDSSGCLLCNVKYSLVHHQRDHLFTKEHVENLRNYFQTSMRSSENNSNTTSASSNNDMDQSCGRIHNDELPILPKSEVTNYVSSSLVYAAAGILSNPFITTTNQSSMFSGFTPVYESSLLPTQPFDPGVHGTPLMLLRLPHLALSHIAKMIQEDATIAQYTDDSSSSNELARMGYDVIPVTIDVGFVCKPCQLAWPRYDACLNHITRCCARSSNDKHSNRILKIEQLLHRCQPCKENFATLSEFLQHSKQPKHLALIGKR